MQAVQQVRLKFVTRVRKTIGLRGRLPGLTPDNLRSGLIRICTRWIWPPAGNAYFGIEMGNESFTLHTPGYIK